MLFQKSCFALSVGVFGPCPKWEEWIHRSEGSKAFWSLKEMITILHCTYIIIKYNPTMSSAYTGYCRVTAVWLLWSPNWCKVLAIFVSYIFFISNNIYSTCTRTPLPKTKQKHLTGLLKSCLLFVKLLNRTRFQKLTHVLCTLLPNPRNLGLLPSSQPLGIITGNLKF